MYIIPWRFLFFHGFYVFCLFVGVTRVTATAVVTAAAVNREV